MGASVGHPERVVVVHQMGKVGSSSVYRALRGVGGVRVLFTHLMHRDILAKYVRRKRAAGQELPDHVGDSRELWRLIRHTDARIDVVTAVRDPIARNVSALFQNLPPEYACEPTRERVGALIRRFLHGYPHSVPVWWLQQHLAEALGVPVFDAPFDPERKELFLEHGRFRVLALRAEDCQAERADAIERRLGLGGVRLDRANVGAEKAYASMYRAFVREFEPPGWLVEKCYRSVMCRHFYSDEEIARFRSRWGVGSTTEASAYVA
ncbi:MAG: putative capsular polysaccharide synthesis family protein [Phycisphaerales bacterium JB040]